MLCVCSVFVCPHVMFVSLWLSSSRPQTCCERCNKYGHLTEPCLPLPHCRSAARCVCPPVCLCVGVSVWMWLRVCLCVSACECLNCLSVCLSIYVSIGLWVSVNLSVSLSVCIYVCMNIICVCFFFLCSSFSVFVCLPNTLKKGRKEVSPSKFLACRTSPNHVKETIFFIEKKKNIYSKETENGGLTNHMKPML